MDPFDDPFADLPRGCKPQTLTPEYKALKCQNSSSHPETVPSNGTENTSKWQADVLYHVHTLKIFQQLSTSFPLNSAWQARVHLQLLKKRRKHSVLSLGQGKHRETFQVLRSLQNSALYRLNSLLSLTSITSQAEICGKGGDMYQWYSMMSNLQG